jgi:hypothetical protein
MRARIFIDEIEAALAQTDVDARVMFSQDDGQVHIWGDGWEYRFVPGELPVRIEQYGTPPASESFRDQVIPLFERWHRHTGVFTPEENRRLRAFRDDRGKP